MLDGGAVSWAMWMQFNRVEFKMPVAGSVTDQTKDYIPGLGGQSNEMHNGAEGNNVPIQCLVRPTLNTIARRKVSVTDTCCDEGQGLCALPVLCLCALC